MRSRWIAISTKNTCAQSLKEANFVKKKITLSFIIIHTSVLNSQMRSGGVKAFKQRESSIGEFEGRFTLSLTSQSTRVILSSDFRISLVFGEPYITFITAYIYMHWKLVAN